MHEYMLLEHLWPKYCLHTDIHYEDIEENFWRSGMAYNHGMDKNGNHIG